MDTITPFKYYYITPSYCVALNPKVGSSSFARAIIQQYYPKIEHLILTASYPQNSGPLIRQWHWMCPGSKEAIKPVVLMVRDPVERFISAMQQVNLDTNDVNRVLENLLENKPFVKKIERDLKDNVHFQFQSNLIHSYLTTYCFKFPDHLETVLEFLDIKVPLLKLNEANNTKPVLTTDQENLVKQYYNKDQLLFDSISEDKKVIDAILSK